MDRNTWHVSDQWIRSYVYQRGKEGETETLSELHRHLRLAEARATLRDGRQWPAESFAAQEIPE
jgi:hypothetical protein